MQNKTKLLKTNGLSNLGKTLTIITIVLWILIFLAGTIVNSFPYRSKIASKTPDTTFLNDFINWIIVLLVYTPTNVALLSILTGLLGALGRCATLHVISKQEETDEFPVDPINPYLSGIIRGFIVYLLIISGMIIVLQSPPISPQTPEQYARLASVVSVVSFIVSYNPKYFGKFLHRAAEAIKKKKDQSNTPD